MTTKERPILFSAPMVRAILEGRKTQTRRILKPEKVFRKLNPYTDPRFDDRGNFNYRSGERTTGMIGLSDPNIAKQWCEYCSCGGEYDPPPGNLWVREAWRIGAWNEGSGEIAIDYLADNHSRREWLQVPEADDFENYWLQSCDDCEKAGIKTDDEGQYHWEPGQSPCRTRPSIFMPRLASRILLEITGVRVERLQDISEADALAEGIKGITKDGTLVKYGIPDSDGYPGTDNTGWPWKEWCTSPVGAYRKLWESINGKGSWDANPWVWVIEFKRVQP